MEREILFYTYGLCTMFYTMMAWFFWRRGSDTLSRQLSPIANDWLIISCLKPVPACAYVARKIYAAKLIIFFDVAITFAPFLSFFFLNVRDSIGC